MKHFRSFIVGLLALGAALTATTQLSAQTTDQGIAKVIAIGGDARYFTTGDSTPHPIKVGMILKPGSIVQTASGAGNYVDVVLNNSRAVAAPSASPSEMAHYQPKAEQDAVRIYENTVLAIDKLTITETGADTVTETELDLKAGSILGTVKKLSPTSKYEVKIPNGVAGIRGTIYALSADGILKVLTGSVVIAYVAPDGTVVTQIVNAGEQFDTNTGLLTPLSTHDIGIIMRHSSGFRVFVNQPTTVGTPDHRIYYVSPVKGGPPFTPPGPPN